MKGLDVLLATSSQTGVGRGLSPLWAQEAAVPGAVALGTNLGCNLQEYGVGNFPISDAPTHIHSKGLLKHFH